MGVVLGKDVILSADFGGETLPFGCARSCTFDIQREFVETSITGSGTFRTFIPSAASFTGTIEGLVALEELGAATTQNMGIIYDMFFNSTPIEITFYEVDETGEHFLSKSCYIYIESISETGSFDNVSTFSINFKGNGQPTINYGEV